jgi:hypothetical protein
MKPTAQIIYRGIVVSMRSEREERGRTEMATKPAA